MEILDTPAAMHAWSARQHREGHSIGLVPTMGALHDGHLALVAEAAHHADRVVVSIFVNPLQFDRRDDFDAYPRPVDDDVARCRALGVHAVYVPTPGAMYPDGYDTHVEPGVLAARLEGEHRPGHFRGVVTVVTKLVAASRADIAVFGSKDAQQLALVRRLVADLDLGVEIVELATVREADGLALSSRNRRLGPDERRAAACMPRAIAAARTAVAGGERSAGAVEAAAASVIRGEPLARLEYARVVDRRTFDGVGRLDDDALLVLAAWVGDVRLIDNDRLDPAVG